MRILMFGLVAAMLDGCGPTQPPPSTQKTGAVIRATATDIPIYDEKLAGPPIDPAKFGPAIQELVGQFDPSEAIEAYKQEHGHYPRDYAEFKSGVMVPNDMKFPEKLPAGFQVQYDEQNHRVVIVKPKSPRR